jgi:putative colanic acid biosynthesis acetyltransferase WcaF
MIIQGNDPYTQASFSLRNRVARGVWGIVWLLLFRPSPRPLHAWRRLLLRIFGAKVGADCAIYPSAKIWAPWNLICEDTVAIASNVDVYNPAPIWLHTHAIVSQGAYLCGATHSVHIASFQLVSKSITIGPYAWVAARATVMPGVSLGMGAVLALGGVATKDIPSWEIHGGIPAKFIAARSSNQ